MNRLTTFIIALLVVLILGFYMVSFQVRYDEVAVLTTFERAAEPTVDPVTGVRTGGSLYREPGLYFKAPWPFQKVTRYSKRLHVLEDQLQEQVTADGRSVIVKTFVAWRIDDPYAFFKSLKNVTKAEAQLRSQLASVNGVVGEYRFDQLVNPDPQQIALAEIEAEAARRIRDQIAPAGYGIEIESVGIRRLLLPETVTQKVFDRMKADRNRLAADLLSQGEAEAARIRQAADSKRARILAFAESRAQQIEAKGAVDALNSYKAFAEDEDFAIFLRQMQALQNMLAHNSTFIFKADDLDLLKMFKHGPTVVTDPETGRATVVPADGGRTGEDR